MLASAPRTAFIPILDRDRARAFYQDTFGLKLLEETPFAIVFDRPGGELRLAKTPAFTPQPFTLVGWMVRDIAADMGKLKSRGVQFEFFDGMPQDNEGVWTAPDGAKICWFKDPDGNVLSLTEQPRSHLE